MDTMKTTWLAFREKYLTWCMRKGCDFIQFHKVYLKSSNEFWLRQVKPNTVSFNVSLAYLRHA